MCAAFRQKKAPPQPYHKNDLAIHRPRPEKARTDHIVLSVRGRPQPTQPQLHTLPRGVPKILSDMVRAYPCCTLTSNFTCILCSTWRPYPSIHIHPTRRGAYGRLPASFHTPALHYRAGRNVPVLRKTGNARRRLCSLLPRVVFLDLWRSHIHCSVFMPDRRYETIEITLRNLLYTVKLLNLL
jgi:hypothetical protein